MRWVKLIKSIAILARTALGQVGVCRIKEAQYDCLRIRNTESNNRLELGLGRTRDHVRNIQKSIYIYPIV